MVLKKIGIIMSITALMVTGCSMDDTGSKPVANEIESKITHLKWKEPVSGIEFTILNPDYISQKKVKDLKSDINQFMPLLTKDTEGLLERRSSIIITLFKKEGSTFSLPGAIDIYNNMIDTTDIGWFLTDAAFSNHSYYKETYRYGPRIGLAWYFEVLYGYSPFHPNEEFLYNRELYATEYPVSIKKNIDDLWYKEMNEDLVNYNYYLNSSFYLYLIETYGLKTYLPLIDLPQTDQTFIKIFGKSLQQLEKDWLNSLSEE
jgi:hypothetical protein